MYGINCLLTNAQIELLTADVAITVYPKDKKTNTKNKLASENFAKASTSDVIAATDKWNEKYGNKPTKGVKIDLAGLKMLSSE